MRTKAKYRLSRSGAHLPSAALALCRAAKLGECSLDDEVLAKHAAAAVSQWCYAYTGATGRDADGIRRLLCERLKK